jgi:hypothetical protein
VPFLYRKFPAKSLNGGMREIQTHTQTLRLGRDRVLAQLLMEFGAQAGATIRNFQ